MPPGSWSPRPGARGAHRGGVAVADDLAEAFGRLPRGRPSPEAHRPRTSSIVASYQHALERVMTAPQVKKPFVHPVTVIAKSRCSITRGMEAEGGRLAVGADVHMPEDTEWGQHEGALVDPDGNVLRFGSPID